MEKSSNLHPKNNDHSETIKGILMGVASAIILVQGIIIYFYQQDGMKSEMIVMGISILPVLAALEFARKDHTQIAGTIIAIGLTIMVTVMATIGQGIHDLGIMAYPAILLVASLNLRREVTISLTAIMIVCCGCLVYGEIYGVYQPLYPDPVTNRF